MSEMSGLDGNITVRGANMAVQLQVTGWSGGIEIDEVVIPPAFGEKWEQADLGAGRIRGSVTAKVAHSTANSQIFDLSDTGNWASFKGLLQLIVDDQDSTVTASWSMISGTTAGTATDAGFAAMFTNVRANRPHAGHVEVTADFRNTGTDAVVYWDEE